MELHAQRDFRRRREKVFAGFADAERFEAFLKSVAGEVRRIDSDTPRWRIAVPGSFGSREAEVTLVVLEPGRALAVQAQATAFESRAEVVFSDLETGGCRVEARVGTTAKTLAARLGLQTLRLGRSRIEARMVQALHFLGRPPT